MVFPAKVAVPVRSARVQLPDGNPFRTTDPVGSPHVGWVMDPGVGASGNAVTVTVALPVIVLEHEAVASTAVTV